MRSIRLLILSLFVCTPGFLIAQFKVELPNFIPSSPEPASIIRGGELSSNLQTGAASSSISLYELKTGFVAVPINLSYSSNGLKVDEIPSRTGLGWNLGGAGVLTRAVRDKPDDLSTRAVFPSGGPTGDQYTLDLLNRRMAGNDPDDTEADEFNFNAPGISGKFVFDTAMHALFLPHANYNVEVVRIPSTGGFLEFIITAPNGIRYRFGGTDAGGTSALEEVYDNTNLGKMDRWQNVITTFFLTAIESPDGRKVNYYYKPLNTRSIISVNHSLERKIDDPRNIQECDGPLPDPTPCEVVNTFHFYESVSDVKYHTVYLEKIKYKNLVTISFNYEERPDSGGDKRINEVKVQNGTDSFSYRLSYADPATYGTAHAMNGYNKRFFLTGIKKFAYGQTDTLKYQFQYTTLENLPPRLSYGQDHYGYYNGKPNENLLPKGIIDLMPGSTYCQADRSSDGTAAMLGLLKKIIYPTGGSQEFVYEPNAVTISVLAPNSFTRSELDGDGGGTSSPSPITYQSDTFRIKKTQVANYLISAQESFNCPGCPVPGPNELNIVQFRIINVTASQTVLTRNIRSYTSMADTISLYPGNVYRTELTVRGQVSYGTSLLTYDSTEFARYIRINRDTGGIRVKKIVSTDHINNKSTAKLFFYNSKNLLHESQGITYFEPRYKSIINRRSRCDEGPTPVGLDFRDCYYETISSTSGSVAFNFSGIHIGYPYITEATDENLTQGVIQHQFEVYPPSIPVGVLYGEEISGVPVNTASNIIGTELSTVVFAGNGKVLRSTNNYYSWDTGLDKKIRSSVIQIKYTSFSAFLNAASSAVAVWPHIWDIFNVNQYEYISQWSHLDSTVTTEYDTANQTLTSKETYLYDSYSNTGPVEKSALNSKKENIRTTFKYPSQLAQTGNIYEVMTNKNMIAAPVEVSVFKGTQLLATTINNFKDWYNNQKIIKPEKIRLKRTPMPDFKDEVIFNRYDTAGNVLEYRKENDKPLSLLWDYENEYLVAQCINSTQSEMAYTSFEADGSGNWNISSATRLSNDGLTGKKYYQLSNGTITKTGLVTSEKYIVSYWTKNTTAFTITGTQGTPVKGRIVNGWTHFMHTVTGITQATLPQVSGLIDELRLYPETAQMVTYTFDTLKGMMSQCDANNQIMYYEYDGLGRLKVIRDQDQHIIKTLEYKYLGQ